MRAPGWPPLALGLAGFGLWGVWPVFAHGLGMAAMNAAHPSGLWAMGVQAALALGTGVGLAGLVCVIREAREKRDARAGSAGSDGSSGSAGLVGSAWCALLLAACLAFAVVLLILQTGQPLRWWFVPAELARGGSLSWLRVLLAQAFPFPLDGFAGVSAGVAILFWLPGPRPRPGPRMRGAALINGCLAIIYFACLGRHTQSFAALDNLAQWAGIGLALSAAFGSGLVCKRLLSAVKRG